MSIINGPTSGYKAVISANYVHIERVWGLKFLALWAASHICIASSFLPPGRCIPPRLCHLAGNHEFINLTDVSNQKHKHCIVKDKSGQAAQDMGNIQFCFVKKKYTF